MKTFILSAQDEHLRALNWRVTTQGYVRRDFYQDGRSAYELLHRVIVGAQADQVVDHINGDTLDNRRENLRVCDNAENTRNRKRHRNNALGIKGVYRKHSGYAAQIRFNGVKHCLGIFPCPEDAARAYRDAAIRLHGAFARLE